MRNHLTPQRLNGTVYPIILTALWLLFVISAAVIFYEHPFTTYPYFPDSLSYLKCSNLPFSGNFFSSERPFVTPLIFKIFRGDPVAITRFYLALSCIAWGALAFAVWRTCRSRLIGILSFGLILLLALSPQVIFWNGALLSESPSFSLFALLWAFTLFRVTLAQPTGARLRLAYDVGLLALMTLWSFSRDSNLIATLLISVWLLIRATTASLTSRVAGKSATSPASLWLVGAGALLIVVAQVASIQRGARWQVPLTNVIEQRVLPNAELTAYFNDRGLLVTPEIMRLAGHWSYEDGYGPRSIPWLESGRGMYIRYWLSHPLLAIVTPLRADFNDMFNQDLAGPYGHYVRPPWLAATALAWPTDTYLVAEAIVAALLALLVAVRSGISAAGPTRLGLWLVVVAVATALAAWHGDANEVNRHALGASLELRVGLLLVIVSCVDTLLIPAMRDARGI